MNKTSKSLGRPTFRIDGARLRDLRKEAGLTLLALAQAVYNRAGKGNASPEVLKNTAQRWESTGAIPRQMALHLADELGTTIAVLQGALPEPASSKVEEIEGRLKHLIASVPSQRLVEAMEYCRESENPTREVAIFLSGRLEAAQLSQAQDEFEDLAAITGLTIKELQQPASFEGFWMMLGSGELASARSEVLTGVREVLHVLRAEIQSFLNRWPGSDAHVSFLEEKHWFRVTLRHPQHHHLTQVLRFVRCQPRESGLQWASPTWTDRYWLQELVKQAYGYANIVTGFDAVQVPADCSSLRLAIFKVPEAPENIQDWNPDAEPQLVSVISMDQESPDAERLEWLMKGGIFHDFVVKRLASNLWEELLPSLAEWPLECWSFRRSQTRIDVLLNVPYRLYATSKSPLRFGWRFTIKLVELLPDGGHKSAPWGEKSVAFVHERLSESLRDALKRETTTPRQNNTE